MCHEYDNIKLVPRSEKPIYNKTKKRYMCQYCLHNLAKRKKVILKNGTVKYNYSKINGYHACPSCVFKDAKERGVKYGQLSRGGGNKDRSAKELNQYMHHKKDYCEAKDGRLGYKCRTKIVTSKQLTIDHIDENFSSGDSNKNHPDNLQTLCHNCHVVKSHFVANALHFEDKLRHMIRTIYVSKEIEFTELKVTRRLNKIINHSKSARRKTAKNG